MSRSPLPVAAAATLLGCAALASSASAAVTGVDKALIVTANTSDVLTAGFGDNAAVSLVRDKVVIAKAVNKNDPAAAPPEGGVNSAHVGALGGCWTTFTPQLLPGDTIQIGADSTVVQGVSAEQLVVQGDRILVHGTAVSGGGVRLPADEIDAQLHPPGGRFSQGSSGGQFLSAQNGDLGGIITYDAPRSTTWTARWPLPSDPADNAFAREATVVGAWTGPAAAPANAGGEETDFEVGGEAGPIASCDTSPYAPNGPTGASNNPVNAAGAAADLVVSGAAQPGVTAVNVTVKDDKGLSASRAAVVKGTGWAATFPAADVARFADGTLSVAGAFKIVAGTFHGTTMSIAKDTVAPAAPAASLPAGTYAGAQSVTLAGESGSTLRYTTDGTDPTAASAAATGPIDVASSETLKAIAVDSAGNVSPVAAFGYVIAPAVGDAGNRAAGMRLAGLSIRSRLRLRTVRRHGIHILLTAPRGAKVVTLGLMRGTRVVSAVTRKVTGNRIMRVVLPRTRKGRRHLRRGSYWVIAAPGLGAKELGVADTRRLRIR